MNSRIRPFLAGCSLAGLILASAGTAASDSEAADDRYGDTATTGSEMTTTESETRGTTGTQQDLSGPQEGLQEAAEVLRNLKEDDPELAQRLAEAKGVFVIPDYATASLLVGGSGGEGVLLDRSDGEWGNPGFYDIGNIDVGAQAGVAAGTIVMLLMSDEALENFRTDTDFSLSAQAGLTIVNWSADAAATSEDGDVLVWSDTSGLLAEASVGVGGISWDEEEAAEFYGQEVTADDVLSGNVENPHREMIETEFAEFSGGTMETDESEEKDSSMEHEATEESFESEGTSEQDW